MSILSHKLYKFKDNLDVLVKSKYSLCLFFVITKSKLELKFSHPGPIHGVMSKRKALMKMPKSNFTPVSGDGCGCECRCYQDCCRSDFGI